MKIKKKVTQFFLIARCRYLGVNLSSVGATDRQTCLCHRLHDTCAASVDMMTSLHLRMLEPEPSPKTCFASSQGKSGSREDAPSIPWLPQNDKSFSPHLSLGKTTCCKAPAFAGWLCGNQNSCRKNYQSDICPPLERKVALRPFLLNPNHKISEWGAEIPE